MTKKYDFTQLDALKKKLDAKRPLDAILYSKVMQKLHIDWTYHSNAIEGNTLTLSETRFYLSFGLTSKGRSLSEYLETKNHKAALGYLEEIVQKKTPLTEWLIKELHAMLFKNNDTVEFADEKGKKVTKSVNPGKYKTENNYVLLSDGSQKRYTNPLKVVDEMQDLIKFYNSNKDKLHPILLATELHARFVNTHPFVDGNGRTSRLIMNIVLMQAGYAPAIIQNEDKETYYSALQEFDDTGDLENFVVIVEKEATRTLQIMLNAAEGKAIFDKDDIGKRLGHFAQTMESLDKDVGKYAKKVSAEEKADSIKKVRDYLHGIAEEKIGEFETENFEFKISYPVSLHKIKLFEDIIQSLEKNNLVLDLKSSTTPFGDEYFDFLDSKDGSGFSINLSGKKSFIPSSACSFVVVPTKYMLCVCCSLVVSEMSDKEIEVHPDIDSNKATSFIKNGVLWEDWNKQDLDNFFNEAFEQFLSMVQQEAEERRVRISEKHG